MKKGDQYYRTLPISGRQRIIILLDLDPENEYLLKVRYTDTGQETRLNKQIIMMKWNPVIGGVQGRIFTFDETEKVKQRFNHGKKN